MEEELRGFMQKFIVMAIEDCAPAVELEEGQPQRDQPSVTYPPPHEAAYIIGRLRRITVIHPSSSANATGKLEQLAKRS